MEKLDKVDHSRKKPAVEHGFRRLGEAIGDPQMVQMCDQSAEQVPIGHPAEKVAHAAADIVSFCRTPGGEATIKAFKKAINGLFSE